LTRRTLANHTVDQFVTALTLAEERGMIEYRKGRSKTLAGYGPVGDSLGTDDLGPGMDAPGEAEETAENPGE